MSVPSESAGRPLPCACTNIALMQLFHELKQKFPAVPDHVVTNTIELYCHDKAACETHLQSEAKASLTYSYHASSLAAARHLNQQPLATPFKCPNQSIIKHTVQSPIAVQSINCQHPQTAKLSSKCTSFESDDEIVNLLPKIETDDNQNIVKKDLNEREVTRELASPITIINIDSCIAKYSKESPSDIESTHEEPSTVNNTFSGNDQPGSTNYKILKSSKIKTNLNEKLELKGRKAVKKEEVNNQELKLPNKEQTEQREEKPKRPSTLDFKPNPDIAFKEITKEPEPEAASSVPTATPRPVVKETSNNYRQEHGYPVNLSVNVNCHMDYGRSYDPWLDNFDSPRTITSVNLTVCTPTSNMASPIHDSQEEDGRFGGQVTVTVSPSSVHPVRRRAPPPPPHMLHPLQPVESLKSPSKQRTESFHGRSLIERQKERLNRLAVAITQEKARLAQLTRETQILMAPTPGPDATARLREYVHRLRDQCDGLAKKLEMCGNEPDSLDFYSHIYTGQQVPALRRPARPAPPPPDEAPSWECHVCTFRNHPLLDKCEECEMPRILVGTSPSTTLDSGFGSFRDRSRRLNPVHHDDSSQGCCS